MAELLSEGDRAPAFTLRDKEGEKHALTKMEEEFIVLFFYPRDNTPGCTIEARGFSADVKKYARLGALPVGISGGDDASKAKFCKKNKLEVLLLSDSDFSVAKKYGAYGPKQFMGKKFDGISRVTFVLDKNRKIIKVYEKVKPAVHSAEVLEFLKEQRDKA